MIIFGSVPLFISCFVCLSSLILGFTSAQKLLLLFFKTISKSTFLIFSVSISLKEGTCFDLNHSLPFVPYFIHHNWICRSRFSFEFADFLSLFLINPLILVTP